MLAASERGGVLHAPDCYMEKIVVGPSCKHSVELDAPVADNLKNIAKRLERDVEDLVVIVLDRPRHEKLIADIRAASVEDLTSVPGITRTVAEAIKDGL